MSQSLMPRSPLTVEQAFARYVMARHLDPVTRITMELPTNGGHRCATARRVTSTAGHASVGMSGWASSSHKPLMRQDESMPWNVHQVAALPARVDEAYEVVSTRLRIQIAHYLADHPEAHMGDIIAAVGSERGTVRSNLSALEKVGVVSASMAVGQREAQRVRYSLDRTRWMELIIRVMTYLPAAPFD